MFQQFSRPAVQLVVLTGKPPDGRLLLQPCQIVDHFREARVEVGVNPMHLDVCQPSDVFLARRGIASQPLPPRKLRGDDAVAKPLRLPQIVGAQVSPHEGSLVRMQSTDIGGRAQLDPPRPIPTVQMQRV